MLIALGWMIVANTTPTFHSPTDQQSTLPVRVAAGPGISVWMDRDQPYQRGDRAHVFIRTAEPAFVTVLRVDTDGQLRVLFPKEPWRTTRVGGSRTFEVTAPAGARPLIIDDFPGVGYLLAIASPSPFHYEDITRGDYWDFRAVSGGRVRGDPYVILADLAQRVAGGNPHGYDIAAYHVGRHYDYPRFMCYDCHSYASYDQWDPYASSCARFRVEIYDDPLYYPYRYQGGRRVVIDRPLHPSPMYVFKDARPGTEYVSRVHGRPDRETRRMMLNRSRTSGDIGKSGAVPAPGIDAPPDQPTPRSGYPLTRRAPQPDSAIPLNRALPGEQATPRARRSREPSDRPDQGREPRPVPQVKREAGKPRSTGEPELRRRKP